ESIPSNILKQAEVAIKEAQVLLFVVDARKGITPLDQNLAKLLRSTGKSVYVVANKVDAYKLEDEKSEFYRFGFEDVFAVSAEQGIGIGELLDAVARHLHEPSAAEREHPGEQKELKLAIVGRPNVGKSSLLNRLIGEERVIVSPVAGTTRDAVDTVLETAGERFRIIDTGGIRRKGKTEQKAEKPFVVMGRNRLERAD